MTCAATASFQSAERLSGRSFLLDLLKAVGCVLIVLHHLAFYGPMSDVVHEAWPGLIDWLSEYGRLAVQLFLVCSGYLTASALMRRPQMDFHRMGHLLLRRYLRLAIPLLGALAMTVLVTEALRPHFDHPSLSASPDGEQLREREALSAGVWYVAIDFQLYLIVLVVLWTATTCARLWPAWRAQALPLQLVLGLTIASLLIWNLNPDLDLYGMYFFGAYGMGWLAFRARQSRMPPKGWAILILLGLLALWMDPRWRITTAWACALLLAAAPLSWVRPVSTASGWKAAVTWLAERSYSVFVIHFAIGLMVSATVSHLWPTQLLGNALGMLAALVLSILAGAGLYRLAEQPAATGPRWLAWCATFLTSGLLAMALAGSG